MSTECMRFLRPCLQRCIKPRPRAAYARFFTAMSRTCTQKDPDAELAQEMATSQTAQDMPQNSIPKSHRAEPSLQSDHAKRVAQLRNHKPMADYYPRVQDVGARISPISIRRVKKKADKLDQGSTDEEWVYRVAGRVISVRFAGSKLVFMDLEQDGSTVQVVCNRGRLSDAESDQERFKSFRHVVRRGDWYSADGHAHKPASGESSILATNIPELLSPALHQIPLKLDDQATKARKPHVDMLVNERAVQTLRVRSRLELSMMDFLRERDFVKVSTPLLTAGVGGAVARPFETRATELANTTLNLRIAPELWLKRLMVGGMAKIYEIGPAFRNEGVDATHNPEFTICELYWQFASIDRLMTFTEEMLIHLEQVILASNGYGGQPMNMSGSIFYSTDSDHRKGSYFQPPFTRLPFIPTLEQEIHRNLPDLGGLDAYEQLKSLMSDLGLQLPASPTVPRLLDALCAKYIEPLCDKPTFITDHPAALSPLSKSFICPQTNQVVSARAELFIRGHEYANMYEEENSPFEQRKKFVEQLEYRKIDGEGDGRAEIDESYLEALEWGLPPTGGWGMGFDRLVMLFTGHKRIGDVLPFGTLRNVVGMGSK